MLWLAALGHHWDVCLGEDTAASILQHTRLQWNKKLRVLLADLVKDRRSTVSTSVEL